MIRPLDRLGIFLLTMLVLALTEASVMHQHGDSALSAASCQFEAHEPSPASGTSPLRVGHVCALCVVAMQGVEPLPAKRWIPLTPTLRPMADPPSVSTLATRHTPLSRRGPPAV